MQDSFGPVWWYTFVELVHKVSHLPLIDVLHLKLHLVGPVVHVQVQFHAIATQLYVCMCMCVCVCVYVCVYVCRD